jgi:hypothetical protein
MHAFVPYISKMHESHNLISDGWKARTSNMERIFNTEYEYLQLKMVSSKSTFRQIPSFTWIAGLLLTQAFSILLRISSN